MSELPRVLQEIADVAGLAAALQIAHEKGGCRCTISAKLKDDNWLVKLVGREAAEKLSRHYGSGLRSTELDIPLGPTGTLSQMRRRMGKMIEEGSATSEAIARATGMSRRTVIRKKKVLKGQGDLF